MRTEEEIIYTIWDIVRGGIINQDDNITERLLRSFLSNHRGKHLSQYYRGGQELPDEVFQNLGTVNFFFQNNEYVSPIIPKTIRFKDNFGLIADIEGYVVSIVGSEEFKTSRKNRFNKFHPLIKYVDNKMVLSKGQKQLGQLEDYSNSELNRTIDLLEEQFSNNDVKVNLRAVLVNPDDEPGYDFTVSPYPFPDEKIEDLINSVNAREFGLFLNRKSDEVGDLRNDAKPQDEREV